MREWVCWPSGVKVSFPVSQNGRKIGVLAALGPRAGQLLLEQHVDTDRTGKLS